MIKLDLLNNMVNAQVHNFTDVSCGVRSWLLTVLLPANLSKVYA